MKCIVVTPEKTALEKDVDFAALPLQDGEIGIARGHSPMIGRLGFGEMRLMVNGQAERYYIDGGFVQIADDVVSVLTERAIPVADLQRTAVEQQLTDNLARPINTEELLEIRDRLITQGRAQLAVLRRSGR
ncbi:MAG: ATP synthase F1 subunit epsilon [Pirellulales bacterium]